MTLAQPAEKPELQPTKGRRRPRRVDPGASLLAHGEPFVWLTSASLVLCILMICGMVGLIVYSGSITFWPVPVTRVELLDGTAYLGEVTRQESYRLNADKVAGLPSSVQKAAQAYLGKDTTKLAQRRLFRTGNFELTQTHFRWVDDFEVKPGTESAPEWAVVLERVEWGRFYGEPKEFVSTTLREPTGDELEFASLLEFLELNVFRLDEAEQKSIAATLEKLRKSLSDVRTKNVHEFVTNVTKDKATRTDAQLDDNMVVPLADVKVGQNVTSAQYVTETAPKAWRAYNELHANIRAGVAKKSRLEKEDLGAINDRINDARLQIRGAEMEFGVSLLEQTDEIVALESQVAAIDAEWATKSKQATKVRSLFPNDEELKTVVDKIIAAFKMEIEEQKNEPEKRLQAIHQKLSKFPSAAYETVEQFLKVNRSATSGRLDVQRQITKLEDENKRYELRLTAASGNDAAIKVADIVLAYPANQLSWSGKLGVYGERWREFLLDEPREANSEGGVFPAIIGTVVMTLFMSLAVVPFGVLSALYLREYARTGTIISIVRIAINNLAGVPSIVFGVFGLGFFCYIIGAFIDGGPKHAGFVPWSSALWLTSIGALAVIAISAFICAFFGMSAGSDDSASKRWLGRVAIVLWIVSTVLFFGIIFFNPYFHGFYATKLPNPTYGKGGLIWASLTLALLTLPVVIVATEEALSAVPNSMREGSYACGAGKWQTIHRIVLPQAAPGIMTGMILAMARGAGEVAPLMLVGAVKLAPELPWLPYRSFMHLGFHIYDLGFQSPNSEAAKPMVYTTTLLLILIIGGLNITAVWLRARLRKRFKGGQF